MPRTGQIDGPASAKRPLSTASQRRRAMISVEEARIRLLADLHPGPAEIGQTAMTVCACIARANRRSGA